MDTDVENDQGNGAPVRQSHPETAEGDPAHRTPGVRPTGLQEEEASEEEAKETVKTVVAPCELFADGKPHGVREVEIPLLGLSRMKLAQEMIRHFHHLPPEKAAFRVEQVVDRLFEDCLEVDDLCMGLAAVAHRLQRRSELAEDGHSSWLDGPAAVLGITDHVLGHWNRDPSKWEGAQGQDMAHEDAWAHFVEEAVGYRYYNVNRPWQ